MLGAAGFLGINLVDALLAEGITPTAARRKRTNVLALRQRKVPMVHAELDSVDELRAALKGASTVFHLAGHYPRHSLDREGAMATGLRQLDNVLDAAAAEGVKRLVYVSSTATVRPHSSLGAVERGAPFDSGLRPPLRDEVASTGTDVSAVELGTPFDSGLRPPPRDEVSPEVASTETDVFPEAPGFGTYHDLKWHMEARAANERRLEVLVACPAACLGPWDLRVGTSAMLVGLARGLDVPHPDGIVSWVDARDVARALVRLARHASPPKRVLLSGGSMRLQELLELAARRYGTSVSKAMTNEAAIAYADAEERRAQAEGGRAGLARELVDLIIHGVAIDATLARTALGIEFRPLDETLTAFDEWARKVRILPQEVSQ